MAALKRIHSQRRNGGFFWRQTLGLYVLCSCLLLNLSGVQGKSIFHRTCSLANVKVVAIALDPETGEYVIVNDGNENNNRTGGDVTSIPGDNGVPTFPDDNEGNNNGGSRLRHLRSSDDSAAQVVPAIHLSDSISTRHLQDDNGILYVRQCYCYYHTRNRPYCPVHKDACGIPRQQDAGVVPAGCFTNNSRTLLIRNAWPVIVLWYGALVIFLFFTEQGRNARHFVYVKCCHASLNHELIDRMIRRPVGRPQRRGLFYWGRRTRPRPHDAMLEELQMATNAAAASTFVTPTLLDLQSTHDQPTQLALKTKRYVAPQQDESVQEVSSSSSSSENDVNCTICFAEIQDGARIGALPCNHIFHVDCLKIWLTRRNVCPLCQTPDVAMPRYPNTEEESNNGNENQEATTENETDTAMPTPIPPPATDMPTPIPPPATTAGTVNEEEETRVRWWRLPTDNFQGRNILQRRNPNAP